MRTLTIIGPGGYGSLAVTLCNAADEVVEALAVTERANTPGVYSGTIAAAPAGVYFVTVFDGQEHLGTFEQVELTGATDEAPIVRDTVNAAGGNSGGGASVAEIAAGVWAYGVRTLTGATVQASTPLVGTKLTLLRGDTIAFSFAGLGGMATRSKLWFTAKLDNGDEDAAAILQVEESAGLVVLNGGAPATDETALVAVTNAVTGTVSVAISAAAAKQLPPTTGGVWDLQLRTADGTVTTLASGALVISKDVTRATS